MISAEDAAGEILRRKLLRASLAEWCIANGYTPARHHRLLIDKLEALARGDIPRLAIFMPPGSAKSTYASVLFPPWCMGQHPKAQFLAASHTTELAERWGRRVRKATRNVPTPMIVMLPSSVDARRYWQPNLSLIWKTMEQPVRSTGLSSRSMISPR
ncbi:hypothetical protein [Bradyrhizobium sp. 1(2017)]|uniref:hypothetical protein n=1 Tax=Bradyrhizobium sp. 1(2017) TaxID=1404888 RepID=UPI00140EF554|nr:hypothetical protein [Bradyrhizobium sp. 1(2017)]QIO34329.1 hypothetical protein HAP40_22295 [Bradyrhizobium sp. 1(2017)]